MYSIGRIRERLKRAQLTKSAGQRFWKEGGSTAVEMALSSCVLFTVFFGFFQTAMAYYSYQYLSDAAREGARWAVVRGSTSCANNGIDHCGAVPGDIQRYIRNLGYPGIDPSKLTATVSYYSAPATSGGDWVSCPSCNAPGNRVKVFLQYSYPMNIPFFPQGTLNLQSVSQMVVAQ